MKKTRAKKPRIYEIDGGNDCRFIHVFSYRHFRIMGWLFMAMGQLGFVFNLFGNASNEGGFMTASTILGFFGALTAPLFLIAVFAQILTAKDGYRKLITLYAGASIGVFLLYLFVFFHYLVGLFGALQGNAQAGTETSTAVVHLFAPNGFLAFNMFIDLLLCALLTFFLNYHPKQFFQGKLIYLFRGFAALPILYELASITLKILASNYVIVMPPPVFPLLTTKPPVAFLIFVAVAFFMKFREVYFRHHGKSLDDYQLFLDTNKNRKQVSRFLILCIVIASIIDVALLFGISIPIASADPYFKVDTAKILLTVVTTVNSWGFGETIGMLLIVPFLWFFDYRKTYANKLIDMLIPAAGIAVVAIITIEGLFQFAKYSIANSVNNPEETDPTAQALVKLLAYIDERP